MDSLLTLTMVVIGSGINQPYIADGGKLNISHSYGHEASPAVFRDSASEQASEASTTDCYPSWHPHTLLPSLVRSPTIDVGKIRNSKLY